MSTVKANTISPDDPTQDITLGASGDTVSIPGNDLRVNTVKDKGGNTLWTSDGSGNISSVNAGLKGNLVLLTTNSFTDAATSSFTTLIDSTYDVYIFKFIEMNPSNNGDSFDVNFSSDGGSNYNMTKTTSTFGASHYENNTDAYIGYATGDDLAQSTAFQPLNSALGNGADMCMDGELHLFDPSSTTYVKHFYARTNGYVYVSMSRDWYTAGYINSTSAVNAVQFKMSSGNNMDGIIKMYGLL